MQNDEQAIRKLVDTWLEASKTGDLSIVLSLMDDDVIFMVPGKEPFGKEAFAASNKAMKDVLIEATSEIQEVKVLGEWAYLWTKLSVVVIPKKGGAPVKRAGHTLSILQKQAGKWAIVRDANLLTVVPQ